METQDCLFWAINNVEVVDNEPFSLKDRPYLVDIYQDDSREKVVQKCAQVGLSVWAIVRLFHQTAVVGKTSIYYFPTDAAIGQFVRGRFDPFVERNPKIKNLVQKTDNVQIKNLGKAFAYFRGMVGKAQKLSTPADMLVFDELDAFPIESDTEIAEERLGASKNPEKLWISTPSIPNFGISRKFEESDKKCWVMKCTACNHENFASLMPFPQCIEQGFLACEKCKRELDPRRGRWVAQNPSSLISGYHIPRFVVPGVDLKSMFEKFKKSLVLSHFFNFALGLPYSDAETQISAGEVLALCGQELMQTRADRDDRTTAGIDVGKTLHVVISRPSRLRSREIIFICEAKSFEELEGILRMFHVKRFVIDALPETHAARDLVRKFPNKGWLCFYNDNQKGEPKWNDEEQTVTVNRTESLDLSQKLLRDKAVILPRRCLEVEEFAEHCASIARKQETDEATGAVKNVWVRTAPDHYRHAFNYDCLNWATGQTPAPAGIIKDERVLASASSVYGKPSTGRVIKFTL